MEIHIASLNVHMWHKAAPDHGYNEAVLQRMLQSEEMDILGLQEAQCGEHYGVPLKEALGLPFMIHSSTLMLLSRFPIVQHERVVLPHHRELLSARLLIEDATEDREAVTLDVHVTHLCHMHEPNRQKQFESIRKRLRTANWRSRPHILLGDFNALLLDDYSEEALEEVSATRAVGHWEEPIDDLLKEVLGVYSDARAEAGPSMEHRIPYKAVNESLGKKHLHTDWMPAHPGKMNEIVAPDDEPLLSTCRFGTRIDYILLSKDDTFIEEPDDQSDYCVVGGRLQKEIDDCGEWKQPESAGLVRFKESSYLVKPYMPATDHNLVTVTLIVTQGNS